MSDDSTRVAPEICHTFGQLLQSLEAGQLDYDLAVQRREEISGLLATIHSQAEVIARQEQELERLAGAERSGDV